MRICGKMGALLAVLLLVVTARPTMAQTQAVNFTAHTADVASVVATVGYHTSVGFSFIPNTDLTITSLGYFDHEANGLLDSHSVGIFGDEGLIRSAIVQEGNTARLSGNFRYTDITPLKLLAGRSYVISATSGADQVAYQFTDLSFDSRVTATSIGLYQWLPNNDLSSVPSFYQGPQLWAGPNFEFTTDDASAVPEPASLLLFLPALGVVTALRRSFGRRSRNRAV